MIKTTREILKDYILINRRSEVFDIKNDKIIPEEKWVSLDWLKKEITALLEKYPIHHTNHALFLHELKLYLCNSSEQKDQHNTGEDKEGSTGGRTPDVGSSPTESSPVHCPVCDESNMKYNLFINGDASKTYDGCMCCGRLFLDKMSSPVQNPIEIVSLFGLTMPEIRERIDFYNQHHFVQKKCTCYNGFLFVDGRISKTCGRCGGAL